MTTSTRPSWREEFRQDRLMNAQIERDRETARVQARIAERLAATPPPVRIGPEPRTGEEPPGRTTVRAPMRAPATAATVPPIRARRPAPAAH